MNNCNKGNSVVGLFRAICFVSLVLEMAPLVLAQVQNWWVLPLTGAVEHGRLDEIKTKRNVFVDVALNRPGLGQITSTTEQADIRKSVVAAFRSIKELSVVSVPEKADFVVILQTTVSVPAPESPRPANFSVVLDQDEEVSVEMTVLVPGGKLPDGTFRSRSVWEGFSPNVQMGALAGSRFVVDGFLWELQKIREKKQERSKAEALPEGLRSNCEAGAYEKCQERVPNLTKRLPCEPHRGSIPQGCEY
jgi:hypothetical protein